MPNAWVYHTPIGALMLAEEGGALTRLLFDGCTMPGELRETPVLALAGAQLQEYFAGKRKEFTIPLALRGTPFQLEAWAALQAVPYGETRCYKDIATQILRPLASRAVGMANNRNPIPVIVPCHRIIGASGALIGYAGGLEVKKQLLELEKRYV